MGDGDASAWGLHDDEEVEEPRLPFLVLRGAERRSGRQGKCASAGDDSAGNGYDAERADGAGPWMCWR